jgi:hypothetical protein
MMLADSSLWTWQWDVAALVVVILTAPFWMKFVYAYADRALEEQDD